MNSTTADSLGLSPVLVALRTCFIAIIALLIISGNILSIAVTCRVTNLADSTKVLMTSLAVSDLLVGFLSLFYTIASALNKWPFGNMGCQISMICSTACFTMSILSLTFLNVERYVAITRPYKFPLWCTGRRAITLVVVASTLGLSAGPFSLLLFNQTAKYFAGPTICFFSNTSPVFSITNLLVADLYPTFLMVFIYYRLIKISRQHEQRLNQNGNNEANNNHDNKALKTFLVVTLTFFGCYTPFLLVNAAESFTGVPSPNWLQFLTVWLNTSNSMFNVWIYCLFNSSFRQVAKAILLKTLPFPCRDRSVAPVVI
ncbi:beta-1 adrenergic receptor-like [Asterias rubens]|uniref:beta-1 adrenergic receptor-like n=1 Tax=Asterias rubens TaxID=7604 RepID=UPI00145522A5|nr:beta-1 adrenergic receptor-like [Asterias rubens]